MLFGLAEGIMGVRSWVAAIGFAALAGCGGGDGGGGNGPGVVLTQTVDAAKGGSIVVDAPGNALNGTVVNIPPNALGTSGTDTISIGYSDTLPGPLDPVAVAAGAKVVSKAIQFTHTSTAELADSVTVTVPYDTATVGPNDVPIVLYWDDSIRQYDTVKVISFSRTGGTITFRTHHFSWYVVGYIVELSAALSGQIPFRGALVGGVDTKFRPNVNGFAVSNFTTVNGSATNGACYGLTAFAKWNFVQNKTPLFTNYFGSKNTLIKNPLEQDLARELIYATFRQTISQNEKIFWDMVSLGAITPLSGIDALTAQQLISNMLWTHEPQMLNLTTNRNSILFLKPGEVAHSVLVYAWSSTHGFTFYDPNSYDKTDLSPPIPRTIDFLWPSFSPYVGDNDVTYRLFTTDAQSSYYSNGDLDKLYAAAPGGSTHQFDRIQILNQALPDGTYSIDPKGTTITGTIGAYPNQSSGQLYAYFYLDDSLLGSGELVLPDGTFGKSIASLLPGKISQELLIIVARSSTAPPTNQTGISDGYYATARATLVDNAMIKITEASCSAFSDPFTNTSISLTIGVTAKGPVGSRLVLSNNFIGTSPPCSSWTLNQSGECQRMAGQPEINISRNNSTFGILFFTNPPYSIPSSIGAALYDSNGALLASATSPVVNSCPLPSPCDPTRKRC